MASVGAIAALTTLCGLGVLALLGVATSRSELAQRAGLAPLTGMAWAGVVAATLATAGSRLGIGGLLLLTAGTCVAGAARLARERTVTGRNRHALTKLDAAFACAAVVVLLVVGATAVIALRVKPLIEYDGWAMWGMKGRAIAALGRADPDVFAGDAYERLHIEYPLLIPALHALPIQAADEYSSNIVILSCLAIGIAGLLALWAVLHDRVRPLLLLPAIAAIAAAPAYFVQLGTGYADVPLATFVAGGVVAAGRWLLDRQTSWLALTTLFLAASVLTKNEGLLFAAAVYASLLLGARGRRRPVVVSALLCALVFAPWRAFITVHGLGAPDYDLSSSLNLPWVVARLDRAPVAAAGLLEKALDVRQFGVLLVLGVGSVALAAVFAPRPLAVLGAGFGTLSLAGLTWVYVLTPNEVDDYLKSNGNRVMMSLIFGMAALAPLLVDESARALAAGRREPPSERDGSLIRP